MKNRRYLYILAFIIPLLLMTIIYACIGIYPFGKKSLLTVDLAGQYVAFFNAYKNIFNGGVNIFYSFSKTLGGNMFGLITYYLLSPVNLILLLFDRVNITEAIFLINIVKIGLCGLTAFIYFRKSFKDKTFIPLVFSTVYALCAYNIVYSQNLLWLDGVIYLPLVFLGIDKLINKEKPILFYITLVLTIIANYYIGYMTCISALIYFTYKLYLKNNYKLSYKENKNDFIYFFKYALLAVGTTMIVLLPSVFSLTAGKAGAGISEFIPKQTYPLIDLISRFFIGSFTNKDLSGGCPNVFISLFMIALVILYFFNSKISKGEKRGTLVLLGIFLASFTFYSLDIIWHLFQHPAGFPFRYSFIFNFITLIIGYKSYQNISGIDRSKFKRLIPIIILMVLIIDKLLYSSNMYYKFIGSGILLCGYILYLCLSKKQNINKLITFLIIGEMVINGVLITANMKYQTRNEYQDFVTNYGNIVDELKEKDSTFYRLEKDYSYSTNDPLLLNYNGISHFSSTFEGNNNSFLGDHLGIFNRFYITNYKGSTLVINSLFNIKYILLNNPVNYYNNLNKYNNVYEDIFVYENQYNLPLGFVVNNNLRDLKLEKLKPFINQNNILKMMTGLNEDVFVKNESIKLELNDVKLQDGKINIYNKIGNDIKSSLKYSIEVENDGLLYGYIASKYNDKVNILVNGKSIVDITNQNDYRYNILELGEYNVGDIINLEIVLLDNKIRFDDIMFYTLDNEVFNKQIDILNNNSSLNIIENKGNYLKGNIELTKDSLLYTSIPFDKGWTIKVDGKKVDSVKIFNSLIGIELSSGKHEIEFVYIPQGLYIGGFVSLISILLTIVLKKRK